MITYPRKLTAPLLKEVKSSRIAVVTGMRQTGKTTLMRQIFDAVPSENKLFLDLENPLNQRVFEEQNFDNILFNLKEFGINPQKKCYIFLDEIQIMPKISHAVKYLYDHYQIKFFLTGSSSFYLKNLFPESLAGRKTIYELFPLDFEEFLVFKQQERQARIGFAQKAKHKNQVSFERYKKFYEEYMRFGGFPGVVLEQNNKQEILADIFTSYFEKDVKALADIKEGKRMRDFILLLANRVGSKFEMSKIASEIGISRETGYAYLSFLEKTYFLFLISPFSRSLNGEVRGAKKVYLCDVGMLQYIGKTTEGAVFENAVFNNLLKYGKIHYYEKYKGPEIDFIINGKIALEAKIRGSEQDVKKLERVARSLKFKERYVISRSYFQNPEAILALDL